MVWDLVILLVAAFICYRAFKYTFEQRALKARRERDRRAQLRSVESKGDSDDAE